MASQISVTYINNWSGGVPNSTAVAVALIPPNSDLTGVLLNLNRAGGLLLSDGQTFIPLSQILRVVGS